MSWCSTGKLGYFTVDPYGPMYNPIKEIDLGRNEITLDINSVDREKLLRLLNTNNRNEKETNKMEAKKCDRCGKLYEMPSACEKTGVDVRFKHMYINGAEDMSGTKIAEKQTRNIYIKCGNYSDDVVDLCPECRKSLKKWFESTDKEEKK